MILVFYPRIVLPLAYHVYKTLDLTLDQICLSRKSARLGFRLHLMYHPMAFSQHIVVFILIYYAGASQLRCAVSYINIVTRTLLGLPKVMMAKFYHFFCARIIIGKGLSETELILGVLFEVFLSPILLAFFVMILIPFFAWIDSCFCKVLSHQSGYNGYSIRFNYSEEHETV